MKTCKTCKYWDSPHGGVWDENDYGTCTILTEQGKEISDSNKEIIPLCEGCVSVRKRVDDFQFVTGINFGCILHKKN